MCTNIVQVLQNCTVINFCFCLVGLVFSSLAFIRSLRSVQFAQFDYLENELMINIPDVCVENNHCITFYVRFLYLHSHCSSCAPYAMATEAQLNTFTASQMFEIDILCEYHFPHFNLCKIHCERCSYCFSIHRESFDKCTRSFRLKIIGPNYLFNM